jgi:hypothetical protein
LSRTAPAPLFFSVLALLFGCARIMAPSGGPEDTIPPELSSVEPAPGPAMPGLRHIVLRFSERLEESTAEVSLYPPLKSEIDVSGRTISIRLAEPLASRILVVHLPGTLSDLRGNPVGASTDLAWGGMESLPSGALSLSFLRQGGGVPSERVLADISTPEGILVRRTSADTSFLATAGWLQPGPYLVTAYEDIDYSFSWEASSEAGHDTTVTLEEGDTLHLAMVLSVVDTLGPRLSSATVEDFHHIQATFDEQVQLPVPGRMPFTLRDSSGAGIAVLGAWKTGSRDERSLVLATAGTGRGTFVLGVEGILDMVGNPGVADSLEVEGTDSLSSDTLRIRSMYPAPGATGAPPSGPYGMSFSDWVDPDSLLARLSMTRILDGAEVPVLLGSEDGRSFSFSPEHELFGEEQYRVRIDSGLVSLQGDTLGAASWSFIPAWGTEPGAIEGSVRGGTHLVLEVAPAGQTGSVILFSTGEDHSFRAEPIPAGRYTVTAYADLNGNGTWDGGSGEPYGAAPGVVLVRPGLTTSGVDIEILP